MTIEATAKFGQIERRVLFDDGVCIGIGLDFRGPQPNAFFLPRAQAAPYKSDGFVGDTRLGGAVNCEVVSLAPHGNGTHTECVGHVVDELVDVHTIVDKRLLTAALVTVPLVPFVDTTDTYVFNVGDNEEVVPSSSLRAVVEALPGARSVDALVIRTTPNPPNRQYETWSGASPAFLTSEAMRFIAEGPWRHVLVDVPSVDRDADGGQLHNHRQWWKLAPGVKTTGGETSDRTITEMIYVPDRLADDLYALSLQVAPFILDAAPSRPILFPLHAE